MKATILKNLRRHYKEGLQAAETKDPLALNIISEAKKAHMRLTVNINRFEKPVGAVVLNGSKADFEVIIEIKKEES